jgi:hypothetical protein
MGEVFTSLREQLHATREEKRMPTANTISLSIKSDSSSPPKVVSNIPWFPGVTVLQAMVIAQAMDQTFSFRAVYHSFYGAFVDDIDDKIDAAPNFWMFSLNHAQSLLGVSEAIVPEDVSGVNVEIEWVFGPPASAATKQQADRKRALHKSK